METVETTRDETKSAVYRAAAERFAKAMRERDYEALAGLLAPGIVINSPIIDGFQFHGREDALKLLKIVSEAIQDLEHDEVLGSGGVWALFFHFRVRGRLVESTDRLRFDDAGQIRELTVFVRPMPGVAAFAAALAPAVGRRRGVLTSIVLRLLIAPLAATTHHGDRLVGWLLRGTWGSGSRG